MNVHTILSTDFNALAAGGGSMAALRTGQRSKRMLVVGEVLSQLRAHMPGICADAGIAEAFAQLVECQRRCPEVVDGVLLEPHVGAWAMHCLRSLVGEGHASPADVGHFGGIAAAAAMRSGRPFDVTCYVRDGSIMFPSLGLARLDVGDGWCRARSRPGEPRMEVWTGGATTIVAIDEEENDCDAWRPIRRLRASAAGIGVCLAVDDLDPYRDREHLRARARLDVVEIVDWQQKFEEAWSLLADGLPEATAAIADGIVSVVPLVPTEASPELSGSSHDAIGAVAMTPPRNPLALALALVHEFQHAKLSALLDLVPLLEPSSERSSYSPWRRDPRPMRGLLQGAYAYLALAGFWDVHRRQASLGGGTGQALAQFELALCREQVAHALASLRRSGRLTPAGRRFADGMSRRLAQYREQAVSSVPHALARLARLDHMTSWRLRNMRPSRDGVAEWTDAWLSDRPRPGSGPLPATAVDGDGPLPSEERLALIRRRLGSSTENRRGADDEDRPADELVFAGRSAEAAEGYRRRIACDPDDLAGWAGLALVRRSTPARHRGFALCPESVYVLHRSIREHTGSGPDPDDLATWMGGTR